MGHYMQTPTNRAEESGFIQDQVEFRIGTVARGKRGTFHDGEGVKLSRKITMQHEDTANNKSFKIQQTLIKLNTERDKSSIRVGFQTSFSLQMKRVKNQ